MSEQKKVYFAYIENEKTDKTANIIIDTINEGDIKNNLLTINSEQFFSKVSKINNKYFIKFYKIREDAPIVLKTDTGEDEELNIPEGAIAEITYIHIDKQYAAIVKTGHSPNLSRFTRYIRELYLLKYKTDEIHEKLQNDIIELYDRSIMEKLKHNQVMKFNLTIADFEDCIDQKDEIDSSFKEIIESAIKNHIITLTFGMTIKEKGLPSKITNTIRYLFRFITAGKISILENEKINEYNLLNHKIQYKYNLGKDETVHLNYDNMLLQGLNWLKEMYERDRGNT